MNPSDTGREEPGDRKVTVAVDAPVGFSCERRERSLSPGGQSRALVSPPANHVEPQRFGGGGQWHFSPRSLPSVWMHRAHLRGVCVHRARLGPRASPGPTRVLPRGPWGAQGSLVSMQALALSCAGVEADYGDIQEAVSSGGRQPGDCESGVWPLSWSPSPIPAPVCSPASPRPRVAGDV